VSSLVSRRRLPLVVAGGLLGLAALWYLRPLWAGLALGLYRAPIVWLPPLLVLAAGAVVFRRSTRWRTIEDLQHGRRPPPWLAVFPIGAMLLLFVVGGLHTTLVARSLAVNTTFEPIDQLPAGGQVRLVPRDVAEQNASSAFNSPTETLTDFRIVNTEDGLQWTALRTPQGAFRIFTRKSQGLVTLDAEQTARQLTQVDAEFEIAPNLRVTDNLRWRLLKRRLLADLQDPVAIPTPDGPRIIVPWLKHTGFPVRRPGLGGVFVVAPDGTIEDLAPEEAARRPELARTGRVFPDTLARSFHDAYALRGGIWNAWFVHEDQTQVTDTEVNRQPYLIDFRGDLGPQWVTVAEPYGRAFAASAIFLTDATTGRTRVWRVPRGRSLSGNRRAIQAVRAVSIPGVDFNNFGVVEPRPVFVNGRLVYLASIIPATANAVSKTVVVDAESNQLVQVFDNDRDPQAAAKTLRYLETGELPDGATPPAPTQADAGGTDDDEPAAPASEEDVERRIDELLERQRELVEQTEALRELLRERDGG
jgi:hypothetical protein